MILTPDLPLIAGFVSAAVLCLAVQFGALCASKLRQLQEDERHDLSIVVNASVTSLALIIGFSFSMAVSRYDLRKGCEKEEASAISTEYIRADLLPAADAQKVRELLTEYTNQRLQYYTTRDQPSRASLNRETEELAAQMWSIILPLVQANPNPAMVFVLSGMNDVVNSLEYTQAAWWNRIPTGACWLLISLAVFCCLLLGYDARRRPALVPMMFPLVVAVCIFLVAEIDSPSVGVIRVLPHNLIKLSQSLTAH